MKTKQKQVYEYFKQQGYGADVPIIELYDNVVRPQAPKSLKGNVRYAQQRLGPFISILNKHLTGEKIVPGEARQTYRIIQKD